MDDHIAEGENWAVAKDYIVAACQEAAWQYRFPVLPGAAKSATARNSKKRVDKYYRYL